MIADMAVRELERYSGRLEESGETDQDEQRKDESG